MKAICFTVLSVLILISCGINKGSEPSSLKSVDLHATVHKPYCGGAKPSPDVAAGYYESMKFEKFKLIKGDTLDPKIPPMRDVDLDEGGNINLQLEPGTYILVHADKYLSLEDFIQKNQPFEEKNFTVKSDECFEDWKKEIDLLFTIVNDTTIEYRKKARCWTGTNPCIEYTGPTAP